MRSASRRTFLRHATTGAAALAASSVLAPRLRAAGTANASYQQSTDITTDPLLMSATRLAGLIRTKQLSATEVVQLNLARIDAVNPTLNAVVARCTARALAEAAAADAALARGRILGPLHGVPMTIKDSFDTAGVVTTAGTLGRRDFVPSEDATLVARLRAAGAILLGKTNTPEFTLSYQTSNLVYGRTENPYKAGYQPGGSSGGAGAIVAAGGSPFDIGTDSGGSVRGPAHFNGIAGLKPTAGRVPRTGHVPGYGGYRDPYQVCGPLARRVEDLELLLPIIAGPDFLDAAIVPVPLQRPADVALPALRVAWFVNNGSATPPTAETAAAIGRAVSALRAAGLTCVEDCPAELLQATLRLRTAIAAADEGATIQRYLQEAGTRQSSPNLRLGRRGLNVPTANFTRQLEEYDTVSSRLLQWFDAYDLIVCPAWPSPAEPWPEPGESPPASGGRNYNHLTPFNNTGWPVTVVRAGGSADGLPIGVQLVARPWCEHVALAAAYVVEAATGGYQPPALALSA